VSYGEERFRDDNNFLDIRRFNPLAIHWDIGDAAIRHHINSSVCGLMLSDIEGACYASTEYLLCGVPVVTTKSFGGRDEYYEEENHLTVRATPAHVAEGVSYFVDKYKHDRINHAAIRARAVLKQRLLRRRLCESLSQMTGIPPVTLEEYVEKSIGGGSKLWAKINYWIKGIAVEN
jgi:glycosyltransferase involved in cell wall biosynthesis